ncbi:MAG: sulfotransferase [Myxococcales bacterium]|nr:sulfotransferase [Myxococcales bacterium]
MRAGLRLASGGAAGQAEQALLNAVHLDPDLTEAWVCLGRILAGRQRRAEAVQCWLRAVVLQPDHLDARVRLGTAMMTAGELDAAAVHAAVAGRLQPDHPRVRTLAAQIAQRRGELQLARKLVAGQRHPSCALVAAEVALAQDRLEDGVAVVQDVLAAAKGVERTLLLHRLGDLHDAAGQPGPAFAAWTEANEGQGLSFEPEAHAAGLAALREGLSPWPALPDDAPRPVLVVGMPRSGTTLLEQALACHPVVAAGGELAVLPDLARFAAERLPLEPPVVDALRNAYLEQIRRVSRTAPVVTDKMPLNALYLPLLARLLPGCRVLVCQRDPADVALSCFRQPFGPGLPWATRIPWIAHMIAEVDHAVAHARTLPLQLLEVRYEALVSEPEATLRAVVSFLGLPWHPPMLHPERLERPVATASAQQVRRPIHTGSVGRAAPYAAWLERVPSRSSTMPAITETVRKTQLA